MVEIDQNTINEIKTLLDIQKKACDIAAEDKKQSLIDRQKGKYLSNRVSKLLSKLDKAIKKNNKLNN